MLYFRLFLGVEEGVDFLTSFLDGVVEIEPSTNTKISASTLPLLKAIVNLPGRWKIWRGGNRSARALIRKLEKTSSLYFEDSATKLIRQSIRDWRKTNGKKIVLVVEDLDRLDPAHLFRILNVFSAHMDFIYRNGDVPDITLVGSKFGFDSVVFVLEYENLKRLFKHFYGDDKAFTGYINKFIPQGYFEYSLRKSANSYFYEIISRITGMDQVHISALLNPFINDISLRDMAYAVQDVDSHVTLESKEDFNIGFLLMLVVMRRLGMKDVLISNTCDGVFRKDSLQFARYIFDFTKLEGFSDEYGRLKMGDSTMYYEVQRGRDGFAELGKMMPVPTEMRLFNMHVFVTKLMSYIIV